MDGQPQRPVAITLKSEGKGKVGADPKALKPFVEAAKKFGEPLTFARTFPPGAHALGMRYDLAAGGINADKDVSLITIPPPQMVAHLHPRQLDGFSARASSTASLPAHLGTSAHTAAATGVPLATLHRLVDLISTRERVSLWWTMGVNQSPKATRTAQAIINLALIAGNIGRPGTGANSITGQCNATSLLGGYDTSNAVHRAHVAATLGLDPALIPDRSGYAHGQILDAIERGEIRGL